MRKEKRLFNKWLEKKWEWIKERPLYPDYRRNTEGGVCPECGKTFNKMGKKRNGRMCHHEVEGANAIYIEQNTKLYNLQVAYYQALRCTSFAEIIKNKDKDRNFYWSYLQVKDFKKETKWMKQILSVS